MVTTLLSILCLTFWFSEAQVPIPTKPLGVHYRNGTHNAPIHIHVFLDLACPDSKMAWPIMKQVADAYPFGTISLKVFIFPLPYHRNAHLAAIVSLLYFVFTLFFLFISLNSLNQVIFAHMDHNVCYQILVSNCLWASKFRAANNYLIRVNS